MSEKSINVSIGSQRPIEVSVGEKKPINVSFEGGITGGDFKNGGDNAIADRRIGNKTAFALSIITNDEDRIIIGADGGITFNDGVEITRFVDDVAANPDNDSVPTSLAIIDYVADQIVPAGGVTSIAAGNGMNFTTITTTGSVIMGTPTTLTASTTNAVTATSHTHSITTGIANTNILRVDHASPTDNDFAKFTANGIEGRSYAEVRADLDLEAGIDFYSKTAEDTWRNSVTQTEMGYLNGVTSDIQTQIDGKEPTFSKNTAFNKDFSTTATDIKMNSVQSLGVLSTMARADHVHPSDTSKQDVITNPVTGTGTDNRVALWNGTTAIDASVVTDVELGYVSGVTSAIQTQLNAKEPTITAGTTAQYWRGDKSWQTLDKAAVGLGNVDNIQQMPLSYLDTDGTLSANSDVRVASQKATKTYVDTIVNAAIRLQGDWNASTNTPDITGTTTTGFAWRVSVAGTTSLGGITDWEIGDLAVKTDTGWLKIDNGDVAAVWGNISGTLSNQTDLQAALDAKVNLSGSPVDNQVAVFNSATAIEGDADFVFDASTGRVGIGTTTPDTTLSVKQSANDITGGITLIASNTGYAGGIWRQNGENGNLILRNQSIDTVYIKNGEVGIGTDTPTATLHIDGNIRIGAYTLPSTDGTEDQVLLTDGDGDVSWEGVPPDSIHRIELNPNEKITNDFSTNLNEWQKIGSYVDSTISIFDSNRLQIDGGTSSQVSTWMDRNSQGLNSVISMDITNNTGYGQIHNRETDQNNHGVAWLNTSGTFTLSKRVSGTLIELDSFSISGYSHTAGYRLTAKTFNNHYSAVLQDASGNVIGLLDKSNDSWFPTQSSENNGLGCAGGVTVLYDNYQAQRTRNFTNIVCLGDSNTYYEGVIPFSSSYPAKLAEIFINDPIAVINEGVAGDRTWSIYARLQTSLFDKKVEGARNIATVYVGVNNIGGSGKTAQETYDSLINLIDEIKTDNWEVWVMTYPPVNGTTATNDALKELNNLIRENADAENYKVIDLWSLIVDPDDDDQKLNAYTWDTNHVGGTGNQAIAEKLADFLVSPYAIVNDVITTERLKTSSGGALVVENNLTITGEVGIGTDTPTERLHIDGNVRIEDMTTAGFVKNSATGVLSGGNSVDISADTNLSASNGVLLTGDNLTTVPAEIDHDSLLNFVANEHIDHTSVTLTAGTGLSGGGDISANRTFAVDLDELTTETSIAAGDFIAMVDITDSGSGKITFANFEGTLDLGNLGGTVDISNQTNLAVTAPITLIDDTVGISLNANHLEESGGSLQIKVDAIDDTLIDWGIGANQVSAVDIPIADAGDYFAGTEVETALQETVTRAEWLQNGFPDGSAVTLTWSDSTPDRTLTVSPISGSYDYYIQGIKYTESGSLTEQITNTTGLWLIYFDSEGVLASILNPSHSQADTIIKTKCLVAFVYWNSSLGDGRLMDERHDFSMSPATHEWIHDNIGAVYKEGMALADFVVDSNGNTTTHAQFSIASGEFYDEDIEHDTTAIASTVGAEIWYLNGANWEWTTRTGYSFRMSGGNVQWNDSGSQAAVGNNDFALIHIFATNITQDDGTAPKYIAIQGQAEYTTRGNARDGADTEINNLVYGDLPLPEIVPVATIIVQNRGTYGAIRTTNSGDSYVDWRGSDLKATGGSVTDHGALAGLSDDDHSQYLLLTGRSGGQTMIGGTDTGDDLTFQTTSDGTKGSYIFAENAASRAAIFDSAKGLVSSSVTDTELGYVSGVTSNIQTQINTKVDTTGTPLNNQIAVFTDANTIEGDADFTWDGATFQVDSVDNVFLVNKTNNVVRIGTSNVAGAARLGIVAGNPTGVPGGNSNEAFQVYTRHANEHGRAVYIEAESLNTIAGSYANQGFNAFLSIYDTANNSNTGLRCGNYAPRIYANTTIGAVSSIQFRPIQVQSGYAPTVTSAWGIKDSGSKIRGGTLTNSYTVYTTNGTKDAGGTFTNQNALYAEDLDVAVNNYVVNSPMTSGANKFGLHFSGTVKHYLNGNVGIGTNAPITALDIAGGISEKVTEVDTATYTILTTDRTLSVTRTATGTCTITAPTAASCWNATKNTGTKFLIKDSGANSSANPITINRQGSDTFIDTATGQTSTTISANGNAKWIQANSATTFIIF